MKSITASGPLMRWRTIDLLTAAFLGVAFGVAYWGWGLAYSVPSNFVSAGYPPLAALFAWPWLVAGMVGMLVIRRPGAAIFTELIAAIVSALIGTGWGTTVLWSGLLEGLGVELGFALLAYRAFGWKPLAIGGFLGGVFEAVYEWFSWFPDWTMDHKLVYALLYGLATAVFGSLLSVGLTTLLARAGALNPFPPGQEVRERHAV